MKLHLPVLSLVLAGCQAPVADTPSAPVPVRTAPTYFADEQVRFEGFEFHLTDIRMGDGYEWQIGQVESDTGFVQVRIVTKNRMKRPVPFGLQPLFHLVDDHDNVYEPSLQHGVHVNYPETLLGESMNPMVTRERTYVFEAPPQSYRFRVLAPSYAVAGFGSTNVSGAHFYYDLGLSDE